MNFFILTIFLLTINIISKADTLSFIPYGKRGQQTTLARYKYISYAKNSLLNASDKLSIKFSGVARFEASYRDMSRLYSGMKPKVIIVNGWQNTPTIELVGEGRTGSINFDFGFAFMHAYMGFDQSVPPNYGQLFQRMTGTATVPTRVGKCNLTVNGIHKLSSLTLGANIQRFSEFYRPPWLWYRNSAEQYSNYYSNIAAKFDNRYVYGGIQGLGVEMVELPGNFETTLLYGKTPASGFFNNTLGVGPPVAYIGGKLAKTYKKNTFAINTSNLSGYEESINNYFRNSSIHTFLSEINLNKVSFFSEIGMGKYSNIHVRKNWSPAVIMKINFNRKFLLKTPLSLQYYHLGRNLQNLASEVMNSAVYDGDRLGYESKGAYDLTFLPGLITDIGVLTNNRQGINVDVEKQFRRLKTSVALGWSEELKNEFNIITFEHRNFGPIRSRFAYYVNGFGPYNDLVQFFMRNFERIKIEEEPTMVNYKKNFYSVNVNLKYKTTILGRYLYVFNYTNYNSVTDKFSFFEAFSKDKPFLRYLYNEFMLSYNLLRKIHLVGIIGNEKVKGNTRTALAENGKPTDQKGLSKGVGLDYNISEAVGVYVRHTWYEHIDKNFVLDDLKGTETSIEFKIFF